MFLGFFFRIVPYLRKDDGIIVNSDKKTQINEAFALHNFLDF